MLLCETHIYMHNIKASLMSLVERSVQWSSRVIRIIHFVKYFSAHPFIMLKQCHCRRIMGWAVSDFTLCTHFFINTRPPLCSSSQSSWLLNGGVLCFLWGTNLIYICYVEESRQPLWSSGQSSWLLNGDVLCFLWGTNWIYICYVEESRPPLWSSGQSSWLQGEMYCVSCEVRTAFIYAM
jgi:hypothetical protein